MSHVALFSPLFLWGSVLARLVKHKKCCVLSIDDRFYDFPLIILLHPFRQLPLNTIWSEPKWPTGGTGALTRQIFVSEVAQAPKIQLEASSPGAFQVTDLFDQLGFSQFMSTAVQNITWALFTHRGGGGGGGSRVQSAHRSGQDKSNEGKIES